MVNYNLISSKCGFQRTEGPPKWNPQTRFHPVWGGGSKSSKSDDVICEYPDGSYNMPGRSTYSSLLMKFSESS